MVASRDAGLESVADEMALSAGKAMDTLDVRESRSSLAGVLMAAAFEGVGVYDFAKDNPTTTVSKEFNTGEEYGFMVQKDNANAAALLAVINEVLKTSKTDGSYDTIYKKWFGVQPA